MQGSGQRLCRINPEDKTAWKQFDRRLGGPHRRSGRHREYKDMLSLPTFEPRFLCCPASSLVVIPTEISRNKVFFFLIMLERNLQMIHLIVCTGVSIFPVLHLILTGTCPVFIVLLQMPDCWLEVSIRNVLRPATSTQVFLGFRVSISKC